MCSWWTPWFRTQHKHSTHLHGVWLGCPGIIIVARGHHSWIACLWYAGIAAAQWLALRFQGSAFILRCDINTSTALTQHRLCAGIAAAGQAQHLQSICLYRITVPAQAQHSHGLVWVQTLQQRGGHRLHASKNFGSSTSMTMTYHLLVCRHCSSTVAGAETADHCSFGHHPCGSFGSGGS